MNETHDQFGPAVTPPHQPQLLTGPTYGEAARPALGEETYPTSGEGTLQAVGEGFHLGLVEGEAPASVTTTPPNGRRSSFIIGENPEERYRCDICGEEFTSEAELERHMNRIGIVE